MRVRLRCVAVMVVVWWAAALPVDARARARDVELGCSPRPAAVYPGEPVTVSGIPLNLDPKAKPAWQWTASGGVAKPGEGGVTVDTTGLPAGEYTVRGSVSARPRPGTAGRRPGEAASCVAVFAVKSFDPPSVTCTAEPGSVVSGGEVGIRATGVSPQGRKLTYGYTASAGVVTGDGPTGTLSTAGLGNTTVDIACNVKDDVGQSASFATRVTVARPEEPAIPQTEELCSLGFTRDKERPVRVDNEAKACLDDLALRLTRGADARLVMIGNASPDERPEAAAQRVLNARQYLVAEKGIETARVEVRVGETSGRTVRDVLVPSGASFSEPSTQPFEERAIARSGEAYGRRRSRRALPAAVGTAQPASP